LNISDAKPKLYCACLWKKAGGEPYTGNLYVRFDEGGGVAPTSTLLSFVVQNQIRIAAPRGFDYFPVIY